LYTPKAHPENLRANFPKEVSEYLLEQGGYDKAYKILANDPHATLDRPYPENGSVNTQVVDKIGQLIENLDSGTKDWGCRFTNCPLAAEFATRNPGNALYQFSMGAFSPVNWILDRVYNRDERLTVLPNTRVFTVNRKAEDKSTIVSLTVSNQAGEEVEIPVVNAAVILAAGTLGSPSIALRSGLGEGCRPATESGNLIGKGLMDHDIWGTRFEVLQGPHLATLNSQPLKLNSWVKFGDEPVLVNMAVNADTFLGPAQAEELPTVYLDESLDEVPEEKFKEALKEQNVTKSVVQVAFSLGAPLDDRNRVLNLPDPTTTIQIERVKDNTGHIPEMQRLAQAIGAALGRKTSDDRRPPLPNVGKAGFGIVGHEVGTMRMGKDGKGVVDENLKVNGLKNLYVCDLSVFPVSPAANPTLTLVALAQRLADHLLSSK
jgi:choline dehydrogenase-like flavoprotein